MRKWMNVETVGSFATLDGIVLRLLGRMEAALQAFPQTEYGRQHEKCAVQMAKALQLACRSDDADLVSHELVSVSDLPSGHLIEFARMPEAWDSWKMFGDIWLWRCFAWAHIVLYCSAGSRIVMPALAMPSGLTREFSGMQGMVMSMTFLIGSVDLLVYCTENRASTIDSGKSPCGEVRDLVPDVRKTRPAWLLEALDKDHEGEMKPSELLLPAA